MKGLFIPEITAEMFRNGCLEGIEALMAEGEIYDINYTGWIPCSERLPSEKDGRVLVTRRDEIMIATYSEFSGRWYLGDMCAVSSENPIAWMPLPKPYKGGDLE